MRDLIVLCPDLDIETAVTTLLRLPKKLGIHQVQFDVLRHPHRDPGCRMKAAPILQNFTDSFRYALVIFDHDGCSSSAPRGQIQQQVQQQLHSNGWPNNCKAIVINPEIEAWIWTSSRATAAYLGCSTTAELNALLSQHNLSHPASPKPPDPKAAMKIICKANRVHHSASLFRHIASKATFRRCQDPAFLEFRDTLRIWFPP